jgi:hypothetical protein
MLRRSTAAAGVSILLLWVVSVAGATGWGPIVNWPLLVAGVVVSSVGGLL